MADLLPGGVHPWHVLDESKANHYSQLQLKRCLEDRNPLLPLMEDKYRSRELVASKEVCHLTELYHWSEDVSIDWDNLPERCVIKTNHWSGDALCIMDNGPVPLANVPRKLRLFSRTDNRYRVIRNGAGSGGFGPPGPCGRYFPSSADPGKFHFPGSNGSVRSI